MMQLGHACKINEYHLVAAAGYDYAEFPCREVTALAPESFDALCKMVSTGPIPVIAMNIYCPPGVVIAGQGFDATVAADYAAQAAQRAAALGVRYVGVGSPLSRRLPQGYSTALAMEQLGQFLTVTAQAFAQHGIALCLEALGPCYCNFVNHLAQACQIAAALELGNLGVVLDFYNMEHTGEADMELAPYMGSICHAHISDDDGTPSQRSYLRPEKFSIHEARVRRLLQAGYTGALTIELDVPADPVRAAQTLRFLRTIP